MTENMEIDSGDRIEVVRRHSLTALVRDEIERHIVDGKLAPGDKLNEADWAARLQVSRGPVREAFRALEQAGLVRNEKNRGVFVRTVSLAEADEIYAVRAVLEEAACRMLASRIDAVQLAALRAHVDAMRAALDAGDHDAYARANVAFHDAIVATAGNGKLYETYRRLVGEVESVPARRAGCTERCDGALACRASRDSLGARRAQCGRGRSADARACGRRQAARA